MMQGTTPKHTFTLPFSTTLISNVQIVYAQNSEVVLIKEMADCDLEDKTITVDLSQEDTFKFDHEINVQIQLRVLTTGNDALVSNPYIISVGECFNKEVLQ